MAVMRFDVVSSAVERMSYNDSTGELTIVYAGGGEYVYEDVPMSVAIECANADSVGRFVNERIKGVYESYDPSKVFGADRLKEILALGEKFNNELLDLSRDQVGDDPSYKTIDDMFVALGHFKFRLGKRIEELEG